MPATDGTDPRIQEFLNSFTEQAWTMVEEGDLGPEDAAQLLNKYQTVARERHDEIVELIPRLGIGDAMFEAERRYGADNVDLRLAGLLAQFPDMRDRITSGEEEIIRHMDSGLTAEDALYEMEMDRAGLNRIPGFRRDVDAVFSAGLYESKIKAAIALDHAKDAAWVRSLGNNTQAAHNNSLPEYIQDRGQDTRSETPWQAPNLPPAYTPGELPPVFQVNANVARHAANPGQHNPPHEYQPERGRSRNTTGAGASEHNQRSSSPGGRRGWSR